MELDLELYRRDILIPESPPVRLSIIDIAPENPNQTLFFIHGFGGQATQWQYQLATFSKSNRVLGLDLRGHGHSEAPRRGYSMKGILKDMETALVQSKVDNQVTIIGHSFGGAIAADFSLTYPNRVDRLILIATPIKYRLNWFFRTGLKLPTSLLRIVGPFTRNWLGAPPSILKSLYDSNMNQWDGRTRFKLVEKPTLIIRGDRDRVFERPAFEDVRDQIVGAEEQNVGASGHMVMLERRKAVDRAIQRFIGEPTTSWRADSSSRLAPDATTQPPDRPWLVHYEAGVPATIPIPPVPVYDLLRSAARRFPNHPAILYEGKRIKYKKLLDLSRRLAISLASLGIGQGDRVMVLLPNLPEFVISYFAILNLGAVPVFTLPITVEDELIRQVDEAGARGIITLDRLAETAVKARQGTDLDWVILTDGGEYLPSPKRLVFRNQNRTKSNTSDIYADLKRVFKFTDLVNVPMSGIPDVDIDPTDPAVIIFTGGTTDTPKGVMLSQRNLVSNALQARYWMPEASEGAERFLSVVPFAHSYGMTVAMNFPITIGASLIVKPKFEVEDVLRTIRKDQPTIFPGVPSMYVAIKDFPGVRKYRIDSIKACLSGAAPLPVEVQESFEKLTRGRLVEAYGLTEASPATHANPLHGLRKEGTIGIPLPSTDARIVDMKKGRKVMPTGQIGELAVRGPQVMLSYWQNEQATRAAVTADGWLLTGDIVQMDTDGYFRLIARKSDMWYPGSPAQPAFPRDVEEVIYEIPQVKEAAVIAVANTPIAFVVSQSPAPDAESIIGYCQRRLPPDLVPKLIIFVDEFPRSFIGKVLRQELRSRYENQHSEN